MMKHSLAVLFVGMSLSFSASDVHAQDCLPAIPGYAFCMNEGSWQAAPTEDPDLVVFSGLHGVARVWRSDTEARGTALGDYFLEGFDQFENADTHEAARDGVAVTVSLTATAATVQNGTPVIATLFEDDQGIVVVETIYPNQFDVPNAAVVNVLMLNIHRQVVAGIQVQND